MDLWENSNEFLHKKHAECGCAWPSHDQKEIKTEDKWKESG
jgi:hypothetical protein